MRHPIANQLSELHLKLGRHSERRSFLHRSRERIEHNRRSVAEDQWTPRQDEVDVLLSIDIPDSRSFAARGDNRLAADTFEGAHGRIHTAREKLASPGHYFRGSHLSARSCRSSPA